MLRLGHELGEPRVHVAQPRGRRVATSVAASSGCVKRIRSPASSTTPASTAGASSTSPSTPATAPPRRRDEQRLAHVVRQRVEPLAHQRTQRPRNVDVVAGRPPARGAATHGRARARRRIAAGRLVHRSSSGRGSRRRAGRAAAAHRSDGERADLDCSAMRPDGVLELRRRRGLVAAAREQGRPAPRSRRRAANNSSPRVVGWSHWNRRPRRRRGPARRALAARTGMRPRAHAGPLPCSPPAAARPQARAVAAPAAAAAPRRALPAAARRARRASCTSDCAPKCAGRNTRAPSRRPAPLQRIVLPIPRLPATTTARAPTGRRSSASRSLPSSLSRPIMVLRPSYPKAAIGIALSAGQGSMAITNPLRARRR